MSNEEKPPQEISLKANKSSDQKSNNRRKKSKKRQNEIRKFEPLANKVLLLSTDYELLKKLSSELQKYWDLNVINFIRAFEENSGIKYHDFFKSESSNRYKELEYKILNDLCEGEHKSIMLLFKPGMLLDAKLDANMNLYNGIKQNFFKIYLHKDYDENKLAKKFASLPQWKDKDKNKVIEGYAMERKSLLKLADATVDVSDVGIKDSALRISQMIRKKN